jgi:capsular polysaccharide biosynthesis protein
MRLVTSLIAVAIGTLPTPTIEKPESSVDTQVRIVTSSNILEKAGKAVHLNLPARELEHRIKVSALTEQLIQIQAFATSPTQARSLSQAVADAYVGYVREAATAVSRAALSDLTKRKTQLENQLTALQDEIEATAKRRKDESPDSTAGRKDAQLTSQLRAGQADISLQLDKVKDEIAAHAPEESGAGTTSVVQRATPPIGQSLLQPLLLWGPLGALLGALLSALAVLTIARTDPRARLRDEIADAVGSPVMASVSSRPQRSVVGWSTLLETYTAGPVDAWAFRQLLRALIPAEARTQIRKGDTRRAGAVDHPRSVTVVSLSGDSRALALGPQLAAFMAGLGISTRLLTAVGNEHAAPLWAACSAERQSDPRPGLVVGEVRADETAEFTVVLAVVDRRDPQLGHALRTATTLLSVSAGAATEEELARLAVAVDDAGHLIDGIVVADPDRSDRTTGRHSLDERNRKFSAPVRLTGLRPEGLGEDRPVRR